MSIPQTVADRRARWMLLWGLTFPTLVTLIYFVLLARFPAAWQQTAYLVGKLLQFGLPAAWMWKVRHATFAVTRPRVSELLEGGALGLVIVGVMFAAYFFGLKPLEILGPVAEAVREKIAGIGVGNAPRFIAVGAFYALGHSLLEEYYWRWFIYGELRRQVATPVAVGVSAVGFMAHHVCVVGWYFGWRTWTGLGLTVFLSLSVACGGVLWALLYERQKSLYGVWLSHLLVDAGIFVIGYDLALR